ncbi:efflux transporter outer membrane subunit [Duganella sp. FT80W]|uniref:Efflux transporter outer membrane subunit n=2 Tax=Duganella guangzhouensis TaxID=2666084 RepID=A0A6I2KUF7_9BURK|nr:efflux transporter outer membrane subunit [Duganella guangzhouensis]MRW89393.1 efflux transporter outer membrane subunit [Duganella guangzhouensis]
MALAACAQAPVQPPPAVPLAHNFRDIPAGWADANAQAPALPADWWTMYNDAQLNTLEQQLIANSPDLASALARYKQAQAATGVARSAQSPTLGMSLNGQRDRQSDLKPLRGSLATSPAEYSSGTLQFDLGYEVDLWGRVAKTVSAGEAQEKAAGADLAAARLSLQIQLADTLLALRGADADIKLLRETEQAYQRQADLVTRRHDGGSASGLDLARAENQVESTRSMLRQRQAQRSVQEHAIAALVGANAAGFTLEPASDAGFVTPPLPLGVPSQLLQRRPDISAAALRVAAASDQVGIARSALFPALTLGLTGGFQSSDFGRFAQASNMFWAVGPTLAVNLLDGGRRRAQIAGAEAQLDEAGAHYRSVVLTAFQQVEDQLTLLNNYDEASKFDHKAADAAGRALDLAKKRYDQGAASYLEVVTAQTAYLQSRRSELDLSTRYRQAGVQLVKAIGGGWQAG